MRALVQIGSEVSRVRLSVWLVLAALTTLSGLITWRFLGVPAAAGQSPSVFQVAGWLFWMSVLAVLFVWLCWVRTDKGWRWRWQKV